MKLIPYTAIIGEKDTSRDDIKCFGEYDKFKDPVMNAKIYKILPHKFLDCDISIWMDGNVHLLISPEELVEKWLGDADMALFRQHRSHNLDQELMWIKYVWRSKNRKVYEEAIRQVEGYKKDNIEIGRKEMGMCGILIRRHTPLIERFNEVWWAEICSKGQRDQLSFPVIRRQFPDLKVNLVDGDVKNCSYIRYEEHKQFIT